MNGRGWGHKRNPVIFSALILTKDEKDNVLKYQFLALPLRMLNGQYGVGLGGWAGRYSGLS